MEKPRAVDMALVDAYLARRALDYLVGFRLSPVLWRKLPGAKSAGRVQSVALRLIVDREMEIEAFRAREYWTVKALLATPRGDTFDARLAVLDGRKLDKFDLANEAAATRAVAAIEARDLAVTAVESKPATRNPSAPFMTSTLQQEASRKFGMGARQTMSAAQRLYEAGHITYMRTDGIDMAPEAVMAARDVIKARYGAPYVPSSPRMYKNKAKNAQEAHECIRPTDMGRSPEAMGSLEPDQRKLYDLIWKRSIASQMEAARFERTTVDVGSNDAQLSLRATGQVVTFDGFLKVYMEGRDDEDIDLGDDGEGGRLPAIVNGEPADKRGVTPEQHFTQAPPRYTEATLVKRMEELGIGRPSTYASIVSTIQEREYVRKEKNRLHPEDKGRLVTAFLANYFRRYVDYDFTADLEEDLDRVTTGDEDWKRLLARFWADFSAALAETEGLRITEVLDKINEVLAPHLFPVTPEDPEPRRCKLCGTGTLSLRTARSGSAFIGCSNYPECRYTRPLAGDADGELAALDGKGARRGRGRPAGGPEEGALRLLRPARRGPRRREAAARLDPEGDGPGRRRPRARAAALVAAAAGRPASRGRHRGRGRHRPLRPVREVGQGLRQPPRPRGGLQHRHEPRRRAPRPEDAARRPRRSRPALARARRAPGRRPGRRLRRPLRPLREVGEGQRHPAEGHRPRGRDARPGAGADRRQGPRGQAQGRAEEGRGPETRGRQARRRPEAAEGDRHRLTPPRRLRGFILAETLSGSPGAPPTGGENKTRRAQARLRRREAARAADRPRRPSGRRACAPPRGRRVPRRPRAPARPAGRGHDATRASC